MSDKIKNMILRRMRKHGDGARLPQQELTSSETKSESVNLAKPKARVMGDLRHQERIPRHAKTEPVTITKSHPHIDYFLLNDQFAVCNRCGIANPIAQFQMEHKTGCKICGAEPRSNAREAMHDGVDCTVEDGTVPASRATDPQGRQYTQKELDNPLSSANDDWTGDPEVDRARLFARAMHAGYLARFRND